MRYKWKIRYSHIHCHRYKLQWAKTCISIVGQKKIFLFSHLFFTCKHIVQIQSEENKFQWTCTCTILVHQVQMNDRPGRKLVRRKRGRKLKHRTCGGNVIQEKKRRKKNSLGTKKSVIKKCWAKIEQGRGEKLWRKLSSPATTFCYVWWNIRKTKNCDKIKWVQRQL